MATSMRNSSGLALTSKKGGNVSQATRSNLNAQQLTRLKLQFATALQASLELDRLLDTFFSHIQTLLPITGIDYAFAEQQQTLSLGSKGKHRCNYRLSLQQVGLGELTVTSKRRFSEPDLELLETLLGSLMCPLNNALQYRQALIAAQQDALTGLSNREALDRALRREAAVAQRRGNPCCMLVVDIDKFKSVNDRYGHATGDDIIRMVAGVIRESIRESDQAFRYGGEEFVVLLDCADTTGARITAERIRLALQARHIRKNDVDIRVTASIGTATLGKCENAEHWFERADTALYHAKNGGRNCVVVAEEMDCLKSNAQLRPIA